MRMPTDTHTNTYIHTHARIHFVLHSTALGTNIAHQDYAKMPSTWESADMARDDNGDDDYGHKTCSHTKTENSPWWTLYFRNVVPVREVIIVNPNCCGK